MARFVHETSASGKAMINLDHVARVETVEPGSCRCVDAEGHELGTIEIAHLSATVDQIPFADSTGANALLLWDSEGELVIERFPVLGWLPSAFPGGSPTPILPMSTDDDSSLLVIELPEGRADWRYVVGGDHRLRDLEAVKRFARAQLGLPSDQVARRDQAQPNASPAR